MQHYPATHICETTSPGSVKCTILCRTPQPELFLPVVTLIATETPGCVIREALLCANEVLAYYGMTVTIGKDHHG